MDIVLRLLVLFLTMLIGQAATQIDTGDIMDDSITAEQMGEMVELQGVVVGTIDDCAADGICALVVEQDSNGERVNVIWAAGMMPCEGEYAGDVVVGDTVQVRAEVRDANYVSICTGVDYYIRKG